MAAEWDTIRGKHFIIYHQDSSKTAREVLQRAEVEYTRIARVFNFTRYRNFWLWDNRVVVRLYPNRIDYLRSTGVPWWSAGRADYRKRTIDTFVGSSTFLDSVLPHEMAHLIFREFIGLDTRVPLWLEEGIAQWADEEQRDRIIGVAAHLHQRGGLTPLRTLTAQNITHMQKGGAAVRFYAQSASLVACMIDGYGPTRFRRFCGAIRDGRPLDEALRFTYPGTIRNLTQLERAWHRFLEELEDE